jgi:mannose-6-phosphate isomerase-like protein (cupin superfamily)
MSIKINLDEKFGLFGEHWRPKVIASLNGQEVKVIKVKGEFPWHHHENEDEFFLVWKGVFRVEFRDHIVEMGPGECVVVPCGVEHRTCAHEEAEILCFEPSGVLNTGNVTDTKYTAPSGIAI